jgi:16S rRNA (guanine(966)-N(2))-methyltransferase RsmD
MRITSGSLKRKKIKTRKGGSTRPLLSRVRKSLFDVLADAIKEKKFLDLYAGSGAVGIEALSRGAREATFIEVNPECIKLIKENLIRCGVSSRARIFQQDVLRILAFLLEKEDFPFIFIGPPYFKGLQDKTLDIIQNLSNYQGEIIVQHHLREKVNFQREGISLVQQRKYGDTYLSFLRKSIYE